jgi:hypothetical protein
VPTPQISQFLNAIVDLRDKEREIIELLLGEGREQSGQLGFGQPVDMSGIDALGGLVASLEAAD